jgi:hypothetical protein
MKILLISFLVIVILIVGFLVAYLVGAVPSFWGMWGSNTTVPGQTASTSSPAFSSSSRSIYAPVYAPPHSERPSNSMPTPTNFKGPSSSSTPSSHGPSGPPPNN